MTKQVTDSYLLGITEGRALHRSMLSETSAKALTIEDMQAALDSAKKAINKNNNKILNDMARGERDYWANQLIKRKVQIAIELRTLINQRAATS